jgi:hypothetical protein
VLTFAEVPELLVQADIESDKQIAIRRPIKMPLGTIVRFDFIPLPF